MNWWASARPSEDDKADRKAWSSVQQPPEASLVLGALIVGMITTEALVTLDGWEKGEPGDEVANADGDESQSNGEGCKVPLSVHKRIRLQEHEDDGIRETGK